MGVLSEPKKTLDPTVWDLTNNGLPKLNKSIKQLIITTIPNIVSIDAVKEVFIIGSITGFKYDSDSDIDVNVRVPLEYITEEAHLKRKSINGQKVPGTKHVINYFLQPYEKEANWADSKFGVYDVLNDKWANPPLDRSQLRDPKKEFYFELLIAKEKLNQFKNIVNKWLYYKNLQNPSPHQILLERKFFKQAKEFAKHIDEQRKLEYEYGWGIPRKSWRNIIYKLIEHSDVGQYFEYLKELKDE